MNNDNVSIVGIEIVEEAVELAKINAKNNVDYQSNLWWRKGFRL